MRLNEAWRVLRDPTLRRQYDATLRRPEPFMPPGFEDREGWGAIFDPVFAPVPPRPRRPLLPHRPARRIGPVPVRYLLLVAVVVVLIGIFVFTAYAGGSGTTAGHGPTHLDAPVGSCVTIPPAGSARVVPCGLANDGVVVAKVAKQGGCPPGALARASVPGGAPDLCLAPR